jgi:hypothetical protein
MATMQYDVWSVKVGSDADFYVVEKHLRWDAAPVSPTC